MMRCRVEIQSYHLSDDERMRYLLSHGSGYNRYYFRFSDLRKFVSSEIVAKNYHASRKTSEKLLKSLMNGVKVITPIFYCIY